MRIIRALYTGLGMLALSLLVWIVVTYLLSPALQAVGSGPDRYYMNLPAARGTLDRLSEFPRLSGRESADRAVRSPGRPAGTPGNKYGGDE